MQINLELQDAAGNSQRGACSVFILHQAVAAFRAANNMSQTDLAERVGVARSTISRLEQGGTPSGATREAIERLLAEEDS